MCNKLMHKLSGVTVLLSLTVFSQVVTDIMPRTSDSVPLLGKIYPLPKLWILECIRPRYIRINGCFISTTKQMTHTYH